MFWLTPPRSGPDPSTNCFSPPPASYLYPSFQGLMSDNDTARLGLDFQRMLRINHMLYIAARSVSSCPQQPVNAPTPPPTPLTAPYLCLFQGPRVCC